MLIQRLPTSKTLTLAEFVTESSHR